MHSKTVRIAGGQLGGSWHYVSPTARKRLVIICHGFQSSAKEPTIVAIAKGLNKKKHDTFTFNFSANTGGFDIKHQVDDITQVVDYFKDYKEIFILAGSFGALPAVIATINVPKIRGLITLNGFFGDRQLGKDHRRLYKKFRVATLVHPTYRKIWHYYRDQFRPHLIKVPVLVIHSKVDENVFIKQSQQFFNQLLGSKRFIELQSANHGVTADVDREQVVSEIDTWLKIK